MDHPQRLSRYSEPPVQIRPALKIKDVSVTSTLRDVSWQAQIDPFRLLIRERLM